MNFKEQLKEDQKVFFNAEEMADELIISGIEIIGILDDNKFSKNNNEFGAFIESKNLSIKESDYTLLNKPKLNDELRINAKRYVIKNIDFLKGIVKIRLEGNKSWRLPQEYNQMN